MVKLTSYLLLSSQAVATKEEKAPVAKPRSNHTSKMTVKQHEEVAAPAEPLPDPVPGEGITVGS